LEDDPATLCRVGMHLDNSDSGLENSKAEL
jgi:hypothetical protein